MRTLNDISYTIQDKRAMYYEEVATKEDIRNLVTEIKDEIMWSDLKLLKVVTKEDLIEYLNKKFNMED